MKLMLKQFLPSRAAERKQFPVGSISPRNLIVLFSVALVISLGVIVSQRQRSEGLNRIKRQLELFHSEVRTRSADAVEISQMYDRAKSQAQFAIDRRGTFNLPMLIVPYDWRSIVPRTNYLGMAWIRLPTWTLGNGVLTNFPQETRFVSVAGGTGTILDASGAPTESHFDVRLANRERMRASLGDHGTFAVLPFSAFCYPFQIVARPASIARFSPSEIRSIAIVQHESAEKVGVYYGLEGQGKLKMDAVKAALRVCIVDATTYEVLVVRSLTNDPPVRINGPRKVFSPEEAVDDSWQQCYTALEGWVFPWRNRSENQTIYHVDALPSAKHLPLSTWRITSFLNMNGMIDNVFLP